MKNNCLISVVLPVYNVELYIVECIESILNQSFKDFELLVIDDCSTDNTLDIIKSYNDSRIKIIEKNENSGLVDSLNLGLDLAKGKYIIRIDGDDVNKLNRFERLFSFMEDNKSVDVCGSWMEAIGVKKDKIFKYLEKDEEIKAFLLKQTAFGHPSVILRRKSFKNIRYNKMFKHIEDYELWVRISDTHNFHNIQEVLVYYRIHENQVSTIYLDIQKQKDIDIRISLYNRLNYDKEKYPNEFLNKLFRVNQYISKKELILFFKWVRNIEFYNKKQKLFNKKTFKYVLNDCSRNVVYKLFFFDMSNLEIDKKWKIETLFYLPIKEILFVITKMISVRFKVLFRN